MCWSSVNNYSRMKYWGFLTLNLPHRIALKDNTDCKDNLEGNVSNIFLWSGFILPPRHLMVLGSTVSNKVEFVNLIKTSQVTILWFDYNLINFSRLYFNVLRHSSSIQPASYLPRALLYLTRANIAWYLNNYLSKQIIKEKSLLGRQFPSAASFQYT